MEQREIHIEITGEEVHPRTTSIKELTSYLTALEEAVVETATDKGLELSDEPVITLTGISEGSNRLHLTVLLAVLPMLGQISHAVSTGGIGTLPYKAQNAIKRIARIAADRDHTVRIAPQPLYQIQEAVITPRSEEAWESTAVQVLVGTTRIYGRCVGITGEQRPHAEIRLVEGKRISAYTSRELAIKLGKMLYEEVCIDGEATWQLPEWTITKFQVTDIHRVVSIPPDKAFEILQRSIGQYWDGVNAEEFVHAERYGKGA